MKRSISLLLVLSLLLPVLSGCGAKPEETEAAAATAEAVVENTVAPTIPEDGSANDVTCQGSYTGDDRMDAEIAHVRKEVLTNADLQVWYWAEVAAYRQADHAEAPDFDKPLDAQPCQIDESVNSWQQYFLRRALTAWHSAQALAVQSQEEGLPTEEAYQPNLKNYETYMVNIPATQFLYGYNTEYAPNTMHQAYLDKLPQTLETMAEAKGYSSVADLAQASFGTTAEALEKAVTLYNLAYTYFTNLSYDIELTQEETDAYFAEHSGEYTDSGYYVNIRHLLVVPEDIVEADKTPAWAKKDTEPTEPVVLEAVQVAQDGTVTCSETAWEAARREAETLLEKWDSGWKPTEATFANLTRQNSDDPGSTINGGAYRRISKGQLTQVLDAWCFDAARQSGDTAILRSDYGYHVVYFSGREEIARVEAEADLMMQRQQEIVAQARKRYPMQVAYTGMVLTEAEGTIGYQDVLYPDVAHERFPEAPLYLQQDYPTTKYGAFFIRGHGCGITTFSMLASYMTDDELTPPEMCAVYGHYSFVSGTDGRLFSDEPAVLGFYMKEKTFDHRKAYQALEDGYMVVSLQHKGYWTRGGHYLLVEKILPDGTVQVRDSNIYNYQKLKGHFIDSFDWSHFPQAGDGFWIFEKKVVTIPACSRCGTPEGVVNSLLVEDYICEKCEPAMLRRNAYLGACES